ncbi:EpsG family protein, partial [Rheinheimera salexigens]|uniref:EpsG family protein n=1 Tax=Rheinheimera salexigens TaxID=1628148 RepID=UPI0039F0F91A
SNFQAAILRVEPLFGASIFIAKKIGLSANDFISLVSFIFHFSLAFFVLRILRFPLILFLLLTTTSFYFNFASNTIRQGLAMSFFMFGLVQKKNKKEIVFYLLSFLTHYSSIILIFYIFIFKNFNFIRNKLLLVFLLAFSVLCFFLDLKSVWLFIGMVASNLDLPQKILVNFNSDAEFVTGRIYYFISFVIVLLSVLFRNRILSVLVKNDISFVVYQKMFYILFFSVLMYPFFIQFSFFTRMSSYGFMIFPIILYFLVNSFFSRRESFIFLLLFYILFSYLLFFQLDYIIY